MPFPANSFYSIAFMFAKQSPNLEFLYCLMLELFMYNVHFAVSNPVNASSVQYGGISASTTISSNAVPSNAKSEMYSVCAPSFTRLSFAEFWKMAYGTIVIASGKVISSSNEL